MDGNKNRYSSKIILDEKFAKVIKSFQWMQLLMGTSRYYVRDREIKPPTIYQKVYTVILSLTIPTVVTLTFHSYVTRYHHTLKATKLMAAGTATFLISYVFNLINVRFVNNMRNVNFIVQMQELDRILGIQNKDFFNRNLGRLNKIAVTVIGLIFIAIMSVASIDGIMTTLLFLGLTTTVFASALEYYACSNLALHFGIRVQFINSIICNHLKPNLIKTKPSYRIIPVDSQMRWIAMQTHDFVTSDTCLYLEKIFTCFSDYQEQFKFQICILFFQYMSFIIIIFGYLLEVLREGIFAIHEWIFVPLFLILGFCIVLTLCLGCELFYRQVAETKKLSIAVMAEYTDGPLRSKAKGMARLVAEAAPRFSVYGMWGLDARVVLSVFAATTTVLITILQFAVL